MQNQRRPQQIATVTMQGTRETERPRERWKNEFAEDLNIMRTETGSQWSDTVGNGGILYWTPRSASERDKGE
jgi:hypothetical protein